MQDRRRLKLDLFALALIALCALAVASLVTYDPADPPGTLVHPPRDFVTNSCGRVGAYLAHWLFAGAGYAAVMVVGSLAWIAFLLLLRRQIDQPVVRGMGWAATLAAVCTLLTLSMPNASPGPEAAAGGYLGAMGFALLDANFATAGGFILALSVLVAGLLLSTDYLLLRFAVDGAAVSTAGLSRLPWFGNRLAQASGEVEAEDAELDAGEEDEYEYEEEYEDDDAGEEAGDDEQEYEYEYEEDAEAGEAADDEEEWEYEEEAEDESEEEPLRVKTPSTRTEAEPMVLTPSGAPASDVAVEAVAAAAEAAASANAPAAPTPVKNRRERSPQRTERDEVRDQLDAADSRGVDDLDYQLPPLDLLLPSDEVSYEEHEKEVRRKARVLEKTFRDFGFNVKVVEIETGPVIAQFEVELEAGLRLSRIIGLADDLAIALRVPSVRIVAPIPGKNTVGIEVPNEHRQLVRLREVIEEANGQASKMRIPIYLGKDVAGNPLVVDLTAMPHLLIAGRTGTGKSVCLNTIIASMLMARGPDEVRMLMIDPKMVELSGYKKLPHLMHPVVTDMRKAEAILAWAVDKMEERYALLARAGVRHVSVYNQLSEEELRDRIEPTSEVEWEEIPRSLPFIVIVADEMADLMMTAGKDVEQHIIRLAQKSRAVGIHLILATQKPTVDVITGLIKSNLPARIAFQVASRTDSRVVLDEMGADKLLGNGDMLFLSPGTSQLLRGQGTYLSDDEITRLTNFVGTDAPQFAQELIELKTKEEEEAAPAGGALKNRDELYEAAVDVVVRERRGSVSLLQRCLGIGYGRAARLIDFMAEDGIVGDYNGSQAREVIVTPEQWAAMARGEEVTPGDGADESAGADLAPPETVALRPAPPQPKAAPPAAARPSAPWEADAEEDEADEDIDHELDDELDEQVEDESEAEEQSEDDEEFAAADCEDESDEEDETGEADEEEYDYDEEDYEEEAEDAELDEEDADEQWEEDSDEEEDDFEESDEELDAEADDEETPAEGESAEQDDEEYEYDYEYEYEDAEGDEQEEAEADDSWEEDEQSLDISADAVQRPVAPPSCSGPRRDSA